MWSNFILLLFSMGVVHACHPQFEKELRYLDLYLGIEPSNDGEIPVKDPTEFASYITESSDLDCSFARNCLWKNSDSDGLLDTSDWWFFEKNDDKVFPYQIQPGTPEIPKGTPLLVAGNTTSTAESAVLLSAPITCQKNQGSISFNYWLYNHAKIEVILVRSTNRRKHLQALTHPRMNCHFLRPANDICHVVLPPVEEPFRIAIRAFNLKDNVVGSMALINNITYKAETCGESPFPSIFSSSSLSPPLSRPVETLSDLNCDHPLGKCPWSNGETTQSEWRVGRSLEQWNRVMEASPQDVQPNSSFLFLVVDSLSPRPYSTLRSGLIPCTQKTTTLSLRYWLKAGTQVEVCSVNEEGIPLSCAYLTEEDAPGPIEIDVDAYNQPFRFTFEIIAFDETSLGLVALSDLRLSGLLCSEQPPPVVTTINPPTIASLFGLQKRPNGNPPYALDLNCDFTRDYCNQWVNDDGKVTYGVVPKNNEKLPMPKEIRGNVAMFLLNGASNSTLRSREVPCAHHALLHVTYMRSEHASLRLCALNKCVEGHDSHGVVSIEASSIHPFVFTIETTSSESAMVVISSISIEGDVCPLRTVEQMVCDKLQCSFQDGMCAYDSPVTRAGDVSLVAPPTAGLECTLTKDHPRSVLVSSLFDLPAPSLLVLSITQHTFGSRVLLCPNVSSDSSLCHELMGPRVTAPEQREITFPLDQSVRQFAIVFSHDHAEQFGPAPFHLHSIDIRTQSDDQLCF